MSSPSFLTQAGNFAGAIAGGADPLMGEVNKCEKILVQAARAWSPALNGPAGCGQCHGWIAVPSLPPSQRLMTDSGIERAALLVDSRRY